MSHLLRIPDRLNQRLRRARPGSVLILVVALLVLMALLGTAYISTARTDRYGAALHTNNTEIDMLVEGMVNQAAAAIAKDLYFSPVGAPAEYRPGRIDAQSPLVIDGYEHYDSPLIDLWLADRIPITENPALTASGANLPRFHGVSFPFTFNNPAGNGYQFERPDSGSPLALPLNPAPLIPRTGYEFEPRVGTFAGQANFPFLEVSRNGTVLGGIPAADADGDGVADAGMWKIPVGTIDGVTYYAAFRIIDNNSAVNVNTAMSQNGDYTGASPPVRFAAAANENFGFFSGSVGLAEMLRTYATAGTGPGSMGLEFQELYNYRFHTPYMKGAAPAAPAGVEGGTGSPLDDAGAARGDFEYRSIFDALQSQLTRRLANPGISGVGTPTAPDRFHPFGFADQAALAYRFVLINPDASPSPLEQVLFDAGQTAGVTDSIYESAPNYATKFRQYAANDFVTWYNDNFDYRVETTPTTFLPRRALLTTSNPVANQMPARYYVPTTDTEPGAYEVPLPASMALYVRPAGPTPADPNPPNPPRASVNTATFAELFRAYWNVMAGDHPAHSPMSRPAGQNGTIELFDKNGNPAGAVIAARRNARLDPYYGQGFAPLGPYANDVLEQHPARMFRSSLRDTRVSAGGFTPGNVTRLNDYNQMLLRAAIAAVNTQDLRDSDDDVTEQRITLNVHEDVAEGTPGTPTEVLVFGTERQPFITEVYVNNDTQSAGPTGPNPNGYVAVELHNPHTVPILLGVTTATNPGGWSVGLVDRRPTTPAPLPARVRTAPEQEIVALDPIAFPNWRFPAGTIIPAGGYLVLENYDPTGTTPGAATYRPLGVTAPPNGVLLPQDTAPNPAVVFVPGLHRVFTNPNDLTATGGELVILRTRLATAEGLPPAGAFNENMNLYDMIPVDQFDFTGMSLPPAASGPFLWAHYVRESLGPNQAWKWVYPGRYDANATIAAPAIPGTINCRHQGVQQAAMTVGAEATVLATAQKPVTIGAGSDAASNLATAYTNRFTIQLANTDFGGPNKVPLAPANQFPYGTFARNGDILQVPFIGAYKILDPTPSGLNTFFEFNSVTMDSVFAEDTDPANDPVAADTGIEDREQIGRFYPIGRSTLAGLGETDDYAYGVAAVPGEYWNAPSAQTPDTPTVPATHVPQWRYRWAMDLFDYLTVHSPNNDFFPNHSSPDTYGLTSTPVANAGGTPGNASQTDAGDPNNDRVEDTRPVEGLININTASWRVLATLPMVLDPATGLVDPVENAELAKAIVYWRDVDGDGTAGAPFVPHGPFKNIMELNRVVDLRTAASTRSFRAGGDSATANSLKFDFTPANDPGNLLGDVSPGAPAINDDVRVDFEEKMLTLTRISNLITTRSDSFTCYLLVQGWRDAGTANPTLVVQRRVAFIVDRSETTPTANPPTKITYIPNN